MIVPALVGAVYLLAGLGLAAIVWRAVFPAREPQCKSAEWTAREACRPHGNVDRVARRNGTCR